MHYFVINEKETDESFLSQQFLIGFDIRATKNRDCKGGDFSRKRLKQVEPEDLECVWSELTIFDKKWFFFRIYRPSSKSQILENLFNELSVSLRETNESKELFF